MPLKIPPPLVALVSCCGMWLLARLLPDLTLSFSYLNYVAMLLAATGLLIEAISVTLFFRSKTTINPVTPERSKKLVVSGLYTVSRNPMYLGMLLLLTAFALWLGSLVAPVLLVFFIWYITTFQIKPEEAALLELFGDDYRAYQSRVRRWL